MSQPKFYLAPNHEKSLGMVELPVAKRWSKPRVGSATGDLDTPRRFNGTPAPGSGYSIKIVKDFVSKLTLDEDEHLDDLIVGFGVLVSKRASLFGRSPFLPDVQFCAKLFGLEEGDQVNLSEFRKMFFKGCAHSYVIQRQIADAVPVETLKMKPSDIDKVPDRMSLFNL